MAYRAIGLGTTAGDGTGDDIRTGGDKVNDNFVELYTLLGNGTTLTSGISSTASVVTLASPIITGIISFADGSVSAPSITNTGDTNTGIYFSNADTFNVTTGGTKRIEIDSSGLDVAGNVIATGTVEPAGDTAAGDNAAIGYTAAEGLILTGQGSTSDITLKNDADATVFTVPTGTDDILFPDNAKVMLGAGSDLQIYHDGSNSLIDDTGTGSLFLRSGLITLSGAGGGETMATFTDDGAVALYHNNVVKLATSAAGGTLTGVWVQTANIAADAITAAKIVDDAIDSEHYTDGSIDTAHIAADAITAGKIADGSITVGKIGADAVTAAKIGDNVINSEHYAADSIDEEHIANDAVGSAELKTLSTLLVKNSGGSTLKTIHGAGA